MSNQDCEVCGNPASSELHLKNGAWSYEPIGNLLGDIPATELDGMLCASWGSQHLTIYVHSKTDVRNAKQEANDE